MSDINLTVVDNHGRHLDLQMSAHVSLAEVAQAAQTRLDLPDYDAARRPVQYALFHGQRGRFLNPELTLYGHQVENGARLRLLPRPHQHLLELELISLPNPGMIYPMPTGEVSIGRDFGNGIVIRHKAVSRQHGIFEWTEGFHVYMDVGSANGSWINNHPVTQPMPLAPGDLLLLGQRVELRYRERQTAPEHVDTGLLNEGAMAAYPEESYTGLVDIPRAQVFISHSPTEDALAQVIAKALRDAGMNPLLTDDDPDTLVRRADALVAIVSRASVKNQAMNRQWQAFADADKFLLPVLYEPARLPDAIEDAPHFIEYNYDDAQLAEDITQMLVKWLV